MCRHSLLDASIEFRPAVARSARDLESPISGTTGTAQGDRPEYLNHWTVRGGQPHHRGAFERRRRSGMPWRVAVGGIWHETNTFAAGLTGLEAFRAYQYAIGDEVLSRYAGTNTELGGMITAAKDLGLELVPTVYAGAVPSGTIARDALETLSRELREHLRRAGPLDGALLVLHGAAVAEGIADADAHVLALVREILGPVVPVAATFDFHANLGPTMVSLADVLVGYDTYPHVDMAERGREATRLLARILETGRRPVRVLRKVPVVTAPLVQATDAEPMRGVMRQVAEVERAPALWCASVAMGFAYADVPELGASVLTYGESKEATQNAADVLTDTIWSRRDRFVPDLVPVETAVAAASAAQETPVVLVDAADNVGGGAPGDGTVVLDALVRAGVCRAVVVIADPEAVASAEAAGEGGVFESLVGGKTDDLHGPPVRLRGRVDRIMDGRYVHQGSYMTGSVTTMGRTALVIADGITVVLTSLRTMPFDAGQLRALGIEPAAQRIIVVKSAVAWRAAFGDIARHAIALDTPGVCASNLERFTYRHRRQPLYPFESEFCLRTG
jgi:microcystin degradation protein MlrC